MRDAQDAFFHRVSRPGELACSLVHYWRMPKGCGNEEVQFERLSTLLLIQRSGLLLFAGATFKMKNLQTVRADVMWFMAGHVLCIIPWLFERFISIIPWLFKRFRSFAKAKHNSLAMVKPSWAGSVFKG
jgi:hypothetical protein